jgi:hypothetical protein
VPEYDAFGREVGADPLAALRDATAPEFVVEPVEAVVAEPVKPEPVPQFVRPTRRRRRVFLAPFIVFGALIAILGVAANVAVNEIEGGLEDLVETPDDLGPSSMIRAANLSAALERMRGSGLGRPLTLRVTPNRVDARLVARNGRQSLVRVTAQQELRTVGTRPGGGAGIPYARIDVTAPERLAREADAERRRIRFLRLDRSGWRAVYR